MTTESGQEEMWASGVFLQTKKRTVLVSEDLGKTPIFMKIPGGRRRPQDRDPVDTAVREIFEETGIRVERDELQFVVSKSRHGHTYWLYSAEIAEERFEERFTVAKNGEQVHVLTLLEFTQRQREILPPHLDLIQEYIFGKNK